MARSKYHAKPTTVDGIRFASQAEARRYAELKMLEKAGEIKGLELQPRFAVFISTVDGCETHVCDYVADFRYVPTRGDRRHVAGEPIVEDVKGMKTPVYRLKKKMVEAQYGIQITEVA